MRTLSALLAVSAAGVTTSLFPAPALGIGDAPAVCDIARAHASAVFDASNAFTDVLHSQGDPTAETAQTKFHETQTDLVQKLHAEADAIDSEAAPADFQPVTKRYTAAERKFADALMQGDLDAFQADVDERNSAQHALFAQCNNAIGEQPQGASDNSAHGPSHDESAPPPGE
jgi:hypothetical protein